MKKYKNYGILVLIIAISIIGCIYALKWHAVYKDNVLNTAIVTDYLHELKKPEFINYLSENPSAVIYFGVTSDENCRKFEKAFKKYVIDHNLSETIVYINVNEIVGPDFGYKLDELYNNENLRKQNKSFKEVPAVAVYNHTNLVNFISSKNLTVEEVDKLFSQYEFYGE